jgi:hypothetical protein
MRARPRSEGGIPICIGEGRNCRLTSNDSEETHERPYPRRVRPYRNPTTTDIQAENCSTPNTTTAPNPSKTSTNSRLAPHSPYSAMRRRAPRRIPTPSNALSSRCPTTRAPTRRASNPRETCRPRDLTPLLTTTLFVSSVFYMNVLALELWLQPVIGRWVPYGPPLYLLVAALIFGVVHLLWVNDDRYASLAAMFSGETASQRKLRTGLLMGTSYCRSSFH